MSDCLVEALQADHRGAVLEMVSTAFADDDPLARSQSIDASSFRKLVDGLYPGFLASGLSFVARDPAHDVIAALVLAESFEQGGDEGSDAIAAIIDLARRRYFAELPARDARLAHIHFVASSPDYRRQGLVQRVVEACLQQAGNLRFDRILVEASGNRSRALLEKHFGFQPRAQIEYADFTWQGKKPFAAIAGHGGLCLMERLL